MRSKSGARGMSDRGSQGDWRLEGRGGGALGGVAPPVALLAAPSVETRSMRRSARSLSSEKLCAMTIAPPSADGAADAAGAREAAHADEAAHAEEMSLGAERWRR